MILITGCAGFVGYHLCNILLKNNKKIIGIDNLNSYYDQKLKIIRLKNLQNYKNFQFIKEDLTKFKDINKLLKKYKFNFIIHLAAQPGVRYSFNEPNKTLYNNLISFNSIIEIARLKKVKKFVYASSSSVYGEVKKFPFTENDSSIRPI
jgi:UDP-glucuronate 4-epimerase